MAREDTQAGRPVKMEQKGLGHWPEPKAAKRTIAIKMSDAMRFTPDLIEVKQGETIRFVIRNEGRMLHEFVLGTKKELDRMPRDAGSSRPWA